MPVQKKYLITAGIVILLLLAIGAFFFFTKTGSKTSDSVTSTTSSPTKTASDAFYFELSDKKLLLTGGFADPSVIYFGGQYLMYVNKFGAGGSANMIYTSSDGVTWKETGKKVPGAPTSRAVVTDSGVRYYYTTQTPIKPSDPPTEIKSAFSKDGVTFTNEAGIRMRPLAGNVIEGPSVIQIGDTYYMYFSEYLGSSLQNRKDAKIYLATSKDGLDWIRVEKPILESDTVVEKIPSDWPQSLRPFVLKRPAGGYVMFYNSHSKIFMAYSEDGKAWKKMGGLGVKGADVDGYYQSDGSIRLYHGDFSEATSGVVYTAVVKETTQKPAEEVLDAPNNQAPVGGNKPPMPNECVGKQKTDLNLPESCKLWFQMQ